MGKRKLSIQKIENDQYRMVSFSKRRKGLFKKAEEFSSLTGAQIAVFVLSEAGRPYGFGSPSLDSVIDQFVSSHTQSIGDQDAPVASSSSPNDDSSPNDGASMSLNNLLEKKFEECESLEELFVWKEYLEELRSRFAMALDLRFVDSLFA